MPETAVRAVLFDFDGTRADTAADLCGAVNRLRIEHGQAPIEVAEGRPWASSGARGLLRVGFGLTPQDASFEAMKARFLECYAGVLLETTRLFPGIAELVAALAERGIAWGIVTNKATRFTVPIVAGLGLTPACVVCGDTTAHLKPHPASLLHAAAELSLAPQDCWYLGDDLRDIQAARAAGMRPVAVTYGYHGELNGPPDTWPADLVIAAPLDLLPHLGR